MYVSNVKVTGNCDASGCNKPAVYWYGDTSIAHCGSSECVGLLNEHVAEQIRQMEYEEREKLRIEEEGW